MLNSYWEWAKQRYSDFTPGTVLSGMVCVKRNGRSGWMMANKVRPGDDIIGWYGRIR